MEVNLARKCIHEMLETRMSVRQTMKRALKKNNIEMTFEMFQIMLILKEDDGISQQSLANQTSKTKASMTNLINNMIKRGWIERKGNQIDRRSKFVCLTDEGKLLHDKLNFIIDEIYNSAVKKVTKEKISECITCLQEMKKAFDEI